MNVPALLASGELIVRGDTNVELVFGILLFTVAGVGFILAALFAGKLIRPQLDHPEKQAAYECGEPAIGDSWVQFDLRFYIVALFFIIFDVEIALLWPWAVIYRESVAAQQAGAGTLVPLFAMLFFLMPIIVGFAYEWRCGYLDWVRAVTGQRPREMAAGQDVIEAEPATT
jgi:NADH-quinone oxidoreductase subunit A